MGFRINASIRRWARSAALIHSIVAHGAAQFSCFATPAFYVFGTPDSPRVADPHRRVAFSSHIEVDIDGIWLLDDAARHGYELGRW